MTLFTEDIVYRIYEIMHLLFGHLCIQGCPSYPLYVFSSATPLLSKQQAYWLASTLATGALLKMRTIGRKEGGFLLRLGDELIAFAPLHQVLAATVADTLPVSVSVLLSDQAKRTARRRGGAGTSPGGASAVNGGHPSPAAWSPGTGISSWQALLGALTNVVETLRSEGVPAPAVRALSLACLRHIDAELLNALLLRRDCCSMSGARVLLAGLAELHGWAAYIGTEWCGGPDQITQALERVAQAARYLVQVQMIDEYYCCGVW